MVTTTAMLKTRDGIEKQVKRGDHVWDTLDDRTWVFIRMVDEDTVELADLDGKLLPDWRHVSQVWAPSH